MPVPPVLIEALTLLSDALDRPLADLQSRLGELADDLTASIRMYLGLTIAVQVDENQVVASTLNPACTMAVASSLRLSLLPPGAAAATGLVVLYSGTRGAFDLIAKDARWIFDLDGPPVVDNHPLSTSAPFGPVGILDLDGCSDFDKAVRALIEGGHTQDQAHAEIRRLAIRYGRTLPQTARLLLTARNPKIS
jgi:hypothetical protein